ncbi:uncharacterized protein LOC136031539 [Artemia franciscana]|uniref:uncharacterized protein LOC136031539 n=1 Tax=Artemia franciscana TaxID=6661 RepID=UPI0032DA15A9
MKIVYMNEWEFISFVSECEELSELRNEYFGRVFGSKYWLIEWMAQRNACAIKQLRFWTESVVNQAKMAVISMFVNSLFIFVNYVISQNVGVGDWVPIFPDQAFGHISSNDFSRRTLDTSFPVNAISKSNSVPKLKQSDLTAVRIDSSENLSNHKLENLKVRAGVSTKNVLPYHPVNFSSLKQGLPYKSDYKINQRGMKEVYLMVNAFLDFIQPGNALPEGNSMSKADSTINGLAEYCAIFLIHRNDCLTVGRFVNLEGEGILVSSNRLIFTNEEANKGQEGMVVSNRYILQFTKGEICSCNLCISSHG